MSLTVLMLDDSPTFLEIVRKVLVSEGHSVVSTANWGELAHLIRRSHPDVLVLDMNLDHPGISGLVIAQTLRKFYAVPILFLSSEPKETLEAATRAVPRSRYLPKANFQQHLGPTLFDVARLVA